MTIFAFLAFIAGVVVGVVATLIYLARSLGG
jgi:hypothetical protein